MYKRSGRFLQHLRNTGNAKGTPTASAKRAKSPDKTNVAPLVNGGLIINKSNAPPKQRSLTTPELASQSFARALKNVTFVAASNSIAGSKPMAQKALQPTPAVSAAVPNREKVPRQEAKDRATPGSLPVQVNKTLVKCPRCPAWVRKDHLTNHLSKVHPSGESNAQAKGRPTAIRRQGFRELRPPNRKRYAVPVTSQPASVEAKLQPAKSEERTQCEVCKAWIRLSDRLVHSKGHMKRQIATGRLPLGRRWSKPVSEKVKDPQRSSDTDAMAHFRTVQGGLPSLGKKR
jgi:hypothetical protein